MLGWTLGWTLWCWLLPLCPSPPQLLCHLCPVLRVLLSAMAMVGTLDIEPSTCSHVSPQTFHSSGQRHTCARMHTHTPPQKTKSTCSSRNLWKLSHPRRAGNRENRLEAEVGMPFKDPSRVDLLPPARPQLPSSSFKAFEIVPHTRDWVFRA